MAEALQLAITAVYSAVEGVQLNQESCARFKKHVQDTERTVVRAASAAKLRPERSVAVRDLTKLYHDAADFMAGFKKKEWYRRGEMRARWPMMLQPSLSPP